MKYISLNLREAASFLNMSPQALRYKAAMGLIPAAKPGKKWCFLEEDLAEYLRSLYANQAKAPWGNTHRSILCHSTKETIIGGLTSLTTDGEYANLLGLATKKQRSKSTTS